MKVHLSDRDEIDLLAHELDSLNVDAAKARLITYVNSLEKEAEIEVKEDLGEKFRNRFSWFVLIVFLINSIGVIVIIWVGFWHDFKYLESKISTPSDRLIDSQVLMVLIAGTVTQTALAFGILTQYVFKVFQKNSS